MDPDVSQRKLWWKGRERPRNICPGCKPDYRNSLPCVSMSTGRLVNSFEALDGEVRAIRRGDDRYRGIRGDALCSPAEGQVERRDSLPSSSSADAKRPQCGRSPARPPAKQRRIADPGLALARPSLRCERRGPILDAWSRSGWRAGNRPLRAMTGPPAPRRDRGRHREAIAQRREIDDAAGRHRRVRARTDPGVHPLRYCRSRRAARNSGDKQGNGRSRTGWRVRHSPLWRKAVAIG